MKRVVDSSGAVKPSAEELRAELRARREAIGASAVWAVPLQVAAIVVTGGLSVYLALSGRWVIWDWLLVGLFVLYVVNAVSFQRLTRRRLP